MTEYIEAEYDVSDRKRKHTGVPRTSWDWQSCIDLVNGEQTQEKVLHRDLHGYLGHSYRETYGLCPKEVLFDANGVKVFEPSHVTVEIEGDAKKGIIYHKAEVMDNQFGKTISRLNRNKLGGFSIVVWNEPHGSKLKSTECYGFDYVYIPNYSENRGYKTAAMAQMDSGSPIIKPIVMFGDFCMYADSVGVYAGQAQMDGAVGAFHRDQAQAHAMIFHLQSELDRMKGVVSSYNTRSHHDSGDLQKMARDNAELTRRVQQLERANRSVRQQGKLGVQMDSGLILPQEKKLLRLSQLESTKKKTTNGNAESKPYVPPLDGLGY